MSTTAPAPATDAALGVLVTPADDGWDAARPAFNTASTSAPRRLRSRSTRRRGGRRAPCAPRGLRVAPQGRATTPAPFGASTT